MTALVGGSVVAVVVVVVLAVLVPQLMDDDDDTGASTQPEDTLAPVEIRNIGFDRRLAVGETAELVCETPSRLDCMVTAFIERNEAPPLRKEMERRDALHATSIDITDDLAPALRYWFEASKCAAIRAPEEDSYTEDVLPRVAIDHTRPAARCAGDDVTFTGSIAEPGDCLVRTEIVRGGELLTTVPMPASDGVYAGSYSVPSGTSPGALEYRLVADGCGVGEWPGGGNYQAVPITSRAPRPRTYPGRTLVAGNALQWKVELPCQTGCTVHVHWWRGDDEKRTVQLGGAGATYQGSLTIDSYGDPVQYYIKADPPCSGRWPASGTKSVDIL